MAEMAPIIFCICYYGISTRRWQEEVSAVHLVEVKEGGWTQVHLTVKPIFLNFHAMILLSLLKKVGINHLAHCQESNIQANTSNKTGNKCFKYRHEALENHPLVSLTIIFSS